MIYLDFQKTFDKVPHKRLISKLRAHGIGDHLCAWIEDWLSDRQRVVLNGEVSDGQNVISGVPQGSALGPTLFIYVNDLEGNLLSKVAKFADDTKVYHKAPKVMKKLYTAFVRPHFEYAIQFWSPNYIKD